MWTELKGFKDCRKRDKGVIDNSCSQEAKNMGSEERSVTNFSRQRFISG